MNVDLFHSMFLRVIRERNIKCRVKGKRAKSIIKKLLEKYKEEDLLLILGSIKHHSEFELYYLLNEETFNKYLEKAKVQKEMKSNPPLEKNYKSILEKVYEYFIEPYIDLSPTPEKTYQDVLLQLPFTDPEVQYWLIADPVFNKMVKLKFVPIEDVNHLKSLYKKKSIRREVEKAFNLLIQEKEKLRKAIEREMEVLNDFTERA